MIQLSLLGLGKKMIYQVGFNFVWVLYSDMEIAVVNKSDKNFLVKLVGHGGPITGVALDPLGTYLASSSCDGSVKIWDIQLGKEEKSINDVFPKCNDFFRALILGRPSWENVTGKFLAIPKGKEVAIYSRGSWELEKCLTDSKIVSVSLKL